MPCALCKLEKPLCDSHIIPEFMYKTLYDQKHRFKIVTITEKAKEYHLQLGVHEKLLCDDCEERFSRYEKYVNGVFRGKTYVVGVRRGDNIQVSGLDYKRFKLFGLSILWRAGVSTLKVFSRVHLGPHEVRLRDMLLNDDPGPPLNYGFLLVVLEGKKGEPKELPYIILNPFQRRFEGHICYNFVFGGFLWLFFVTKHELPNKYQTGFVNENGQMLMAVEKISNIPFINETLHNAAKN